MSLVDDGVLSLLSSLGSWVFFLVLLRVITFVETARPFRRGA